MSIIINKQNEYIKYQVTHVLTREEICDIIFNDYKLREEKLTQKKVDEVVRGHLIVVGLCERDDIGYYRRNVVDNGLRI